MGEGRENNCIWQKNLPSGQQRALGSQSLAMDSVPAVGNVEEAESFSLQSQFGSVQVEKGFQLLGGGGKAPGPTQEATAAC